MEKIQIPFNKPCIIGKELYYIAQAVLNGKISGDGEFTQKCSKLIEEKFKVKKVLLTTSCSSALDMSAILLNTKPDDEVIMPSYTFVSTANSFLIRGANIKFADIRGDTLNINENKIEELTTKNTKAIVVVHYAGVSCEMDRITDIANRYNLLVVEDAAQGFSSKYNNKYLGTLGDIGCFSFHETKNITCGEGGAILLNNSDFIERAEIIREKGTNRSKFHRGEVDKYTWVDIGSSFLPSEILSAFLYTQLESEKLITSYRKNAWNYYYDNLKDFEDRGFLKRPYIPGNCIHNGHLFYIILESEKIRDSLMNYFEKANILAVFHYIPLHLSPMGKKLGYKKGDLIITEDLSSRLLRLPLYYRITKNEQNLVIDVINNFFK
jgi:dTDP-4-amino-4,6-dideoxygalactose transaminase